MIQQQSCRKHASNAAEKRNLAAQLFCVASFLPSITTRKRCGHNRITLTLPRPDDKPVRKCTLGSRRDTTFPYLISRHWSKSIEDTGQPALAKGLAGEKLQLLQRFSYLRYTFPHCRALKSYLDQGSSANAGDMQTFSEETEEEEGADDNDDEEEEE